MYLRLILFLVVIFFITNTYSMRYPTRSRGYSVCLVAKNSTGNEERVFVPQVARSRNRSLTRSDICRAMQRLSPEMVKNIRSRF